MPSILISDIETTERAGVIQTVFGPTQYLWSQRKNGCCG